MIERELAGLLAGAVALGAVHGMEPGHGWPVAAAYAMEQSNEWVSGIAASTILGLGHLVSSLAMVGVFFYAKSYFSLTQVNEPLTVAGLQIGGPVSVVAGVLLIVLGIRESTGGHSHGISDGDTHDHADSHTRSGGHHDHGHSHDGHAHAHGDDRTERNHVDGLRTRLGDLLPFVGGHEHDHGSLSTAADRGLLSIAWAAFLLGFAHEEEFEIIALCAGSNYCLELMSAYAVTVIAGIVGLTALLLAGYDRYEDEVERITPYLPLFSATVLILMGVGFITGLF
ncbi:hypothetical protein [Haloarcula montana]|uniref:hypothetical protein n=1 Tax=Haloarcula montana TaxID=3111776 RepID=UPI002D794EBE|nr:hypothetical protein [Haloarcula sp. GH36]